MRGEHVSLVLYITGDSPRSQSAIANLRSMCEGALQERCDFSVVDLLDSPGDAERDRILATPTLVKQAPGKVRRVIGDLSDAASVLAALDIVPD